jgi:hypothetical protein
VETLDTEQQIEADLEERGSVYVAGANQRGQLGVGDKEPRRCFTVVQQLRGVGVVYVASSADLCYAVTEEHDVYVWGGAGVGRTGLNLALMKKSVTDSSVINNWMEPQLVADLAGEEVSGKDAIWLLVRAFSSRPAPPCANALNVRGQVLLQHSPYVPFALPPYSCLDWVVT